MTPNLTDTRSPPFLQTPEQPRQMTTVSLVVPQSRLSLPATTPRTPSVSTSPSSRTIIKEHGTITIISSFRSLLTALTTPSSNTIDSLHEKSLIRLLWKPIVDAVK